MNFLDPVALIVFVASVALAFFGARLARNLWKPTQQAPKEPQTRAERRRRKFGRR
jgi:hypothetical protein